MNGDPDSYTGPIWLGVLLATGALTAVIAVVAAVIWAIGRIV